MPVAAPSLTARTLYAGLREAALALGASQCIGPLPGSVVTKSLRGRIDWTRVTLAEDRQRLDEVRAAFVAAPAAALASWLSMIAATGA